MRDVCFIAEYGTRKHSESGVFVPAVALSFSDEYPTQALALAAAKYHAKYTEIALLTASATARSYKPKQN